MKPLRLRTRRNDKGAVAVETALVCSLLITILYGVVEVSFLFRDAMTVSSASRAGARLASSLPRQDFAAAAAAQVQDAMSGLPVDRIQDVWVYKAATTGSPPRPSSTVPGSCSANCARFVPSGGNLTRSGGSGWSATSQNACNRSQDYVGVLVRYSYPTRVGLFNNKLLAEQTVMRLEPYVGTGGCS